MCIPWLAPAEKLSTDRASSRFLLQYSARDEVTLHGKGNGGVAEAQEAVQGYGEESPLYGFIHFRRRKVILKYVPEGTSRLLQGRLNHLQPNLVQA